MKPPMQLVATKVVKMERSGCPSRFFACWPGISQFNDPTQSQVIPPTELRHRCSEDWRQQSLPLQPWWHMVATEERRSKPGWSLARDAPRPRKKQGWECPAPSVEDWEDYKEWLQQQERKQELPSGPQIFLADVSLLFHQDPDVKLPWIHRVKCELPRRVGRLAGDLPVKASYIGFGTDAAAEGYELFKEAMTEIGILLCRHIHHPPNRFELAHLEQSDLVFLDRGDRKRLWETLGTDIGSEVAEHVKWRYLQGAVIIAVGESMTLLGEKSWYCSNDMVVPFKGWGIFPHIVAPEDGTDMEDLVEQLGGAGVVVLGIHKGGGMIFNKDGLVEPAQQMIQEYRWDWQSTSVKQALLLGPPRNTGLICPLYVASRGAFEDDELQDVYAYALTTTEEEEEERLISKFDPFDKWVTAETQQELDALKKQGNEAFKAGKADLAYVHYNHAQVLLSSSSKPWAELPEDFRNDLQPSGQQASTGSKSGKENYKASTIQLSLLLNICASSLMAHSQDVARRKEEAESKEKVEAMPAPAAHEDSTMLVEVKDNLVLAFRAANEALRISLARSAKAWFRRAMTFEKMRDYRNAVLDLEEALLREPGDKTITKKRNEMRDLASQVAENMYYARHKELDLQEQRLKLETRRSLHLLGYLGVDKYDDKDQQFAVQQPLARVVESTLEEVDGRLALRAPTVAAAETAPYLHTHALWTWEFLVQRSVGLRMLCIEDVDLGSGPLEWLCKGLRSHQEIQALYLTGVHLGPAGSKMMRNVLAQNRSLIEIKLDSCGFLDSGLAELSDGLMDHCGQLEFLSLRQNLITSRKLSKLVAALCTGESSPSLGELDLSENPLGAEGAKELAKALSSSSHNLRVLRLQDCQMDLAAFWRLVAKLDNDRPLTQLDLRVNPIGPGTRRCWRGTMAPNIRCEVMLSDRPLKAKREVAEERTASFPLPRWWDFLAAFGVQYSRRASSPKSRNS
eukprot:s617_g2.t1